MARSPARIYVSKARHYATQYQKPPSMAIIVGRTQGLQFAQKEVAVISTSIAIILGHRPLYLVARRGPCGQGSLTAVFGRHFSRALVTEWVKAERHLPVRQLVKALNTRLRGHYNYYGVIGNSRSLWAYFHQATGLLMEWLGTEEPGALLPERCEHERKQGWRFS
jgi:hypothetical protein